MHQNRNSLISYLKSMHKRGFFYLSNGIMDHKVKSEILTHINEMRFAFIN